MNACLEVQFKLTGPVLLRSIRATRIGLDAHGEFDPQGQRAVVPGTHLRGQVRHALSGIRSLLAGQTAAQHEVDQVLALLGAKSAEDSGNAPERASLQFPDAFTCLDAPALTRLHRIRMHEDGRVDDGALLVLESALAPGQTAGFSGSLRLLQADAGIALPRIAYWLQRALSLVPALGSLKGVGFGTLSAPTVRAVTPAAAVMQGAVPAVEPAKRWAVQFQLDRPYCFAQPHGADSNRFTSLDYIPGAALLGALMGHVARRPADCAHAQVLRTWGHALRFTHARMVGSGTHPRTRVLPRSWVKAKDHFHDVAGCKQAQLIDEVAPAFSLDWKDEDWKQLHRQQRGLHREPSRILRVRTAIEAKDRSAQEQALFATECVDPGDARFHAEISVMSDDQSVAAKLLSALHVVLPQALQPLGKTKAVAQNVEWVAADSWTVPDGLRPGEWLAIELQSDAALEMLGTESLPLVGAGDTLQSLYGQWMSKISNESLRYSHGFQAQSLAGGAYLWHRYWGGPRERYGPVVLTEAGSVWVCEVVDAVRARALLEDWLIHGLPDGQTRAHGNRHAWECNPYRRENGCGEIFVRRLAQPGQAVRLDPTQEHGS